MKRLLSLDHPTTPGLNPVQVIALAHDLGCDAVVLRMQTDPRFASNPYVISDDTALRRQIRDEVAARGLFVAAGCAMEIRPGTVVANLQAGIDAAAEIGAHALTVVNYDTDKSTHPDTMGELAERCGKVGVRPLLEFFKLSGIDSLPYSLDLIRRIGHPALGLSIDSLHLTRTGGTAAEVAAVPQGLIVHAQLNDGPLYQPPELQMPEAWGERLLPGDGEFDLMGLVRVLPPHVPIGVEAGTMSQFAKGVSMEDHGRAAVAAMRQVIAQALETN